MRYKIVELTLGDDSKRWAIRKGFWPFGGYVDRRDNYVWHGDKNVLEYSCFETHELATAKLRFLENDSGIIKKAKKVKPWRAEGPW